MDTNAEKRRTTISIPEQLIERALKVRPGREQRVLSAVVSEALERFVAEEEQAEFERQLEKMAHDPHVRAEVARINEEFAATETDGLGGQ